ncbi:MAG: hypothetical protein JWP46_2018 [Modestobacter sp.]|jgi:hypothetical protein|nr:hypothetical protein [Modestobacter sp.]
MTAQLRAVTLACWLILLAASLIKGSREHRRDAPRVDADDVYAQARGARRTPPGGLTGFVPEGG